MKTNKVNGPKERILETASRLFYKQGYNSTGINQILEEAKVAKASLYQHFGSKEDVGLEYLQIARVEWFEGLGKWVDSKNAPAQKVMDCFDFLEYALRNNDFRGCKFINMLSELGDLNSPMQEEIIGHKAKLRTYIKALVKEALPEKPNEEQQTIGDSIYLLFEGSIIESKIYKNSWPTKAAKKMVKVLLKKN